MKRTLVVSEIALRGAQGGAALLVGLIMLALVTIHAVAAFTGGSTMLRIAGNMQGRQEAQAAGNMAVAQVLSSGLFMIDPAGVASNVFSVDINGDGAADFQVTVTPTCKSAKPLLNMDLDPDAPEDFMCVTGTAFGGSSLCSNSAWDLKAISRVAGGTAGAGISTEIHQGAVVRIETSEAGRVCRFLPDAPPA